MPESFHIQTILEKYFPFEIGRYIGDIVNTYDVSFVLSRPRKTKLGDFRVDYRTKKCSISVNRDLTYAQFLITTVHELAHVVTWNNYGKSVLPHGKEWKETYRRLFHPILSMIDDEILKTAILEHIQNPKASSYADYKLMEVINVESDVLLLKDVPLNTTFLIGERTFVKQKKLRTRYLCEDISTNRRYYVHGMAKISYIG